MHSHLPVFSQHFHSNTNFLESALQACGSWGKTARQGALGPCSRTLPTRCVRRLSLGTQNYVVGLTAPSMSHSCTTGTSTATQEPNTTSVVPPTNSPSLPFPHPVIHTNQAPSTLINQVHPIVGNFYGDCLQHCLYIFCAYSHLVEALNSLQVGIQDFIVCSKLGSYSGWMSEGYRGSDLLRVG